MRIAIVVAILFTVACQSVNQEDVGECLEWKMSMVEKKERLPFPMSGVVVREEMIAVCTSREDLPDDEG
jgi:hypothetical protein